MTENPFIKVANDRVEQIIRTRRVEQEKLQAQTIVQQKAFETASNWWKSTFEPALNQLNEAIKPHDMHTKVTDKSSHPAAGRIVKALVCKRGNYASQPYLVIADGEGFTVYVKDEEHCLDGFSWPRPLDDTNTVIAFLSKMIELNLV